VHHVLEAARANKARVILASSGQVNWHQQETGPYPIRIDHPLSPRYWYAVTKIFSEFAGRVYTETHGLDVVAVRLGACPRDRAFVEGLSRNEIPQDVYLSPGDAGRFFKRAVETDGGFGFKIVYVFSKSINRPIFDLEPARSLCGFQPQDRWPEGLPPELAIPLR
jgi:nucleoside-diphosphate-sugar epimerase